MFVSSYLKIACPVNSDKVKSDKVCTYGSVGNVARSVKSWSDTI